MSGMIDTAQKMFWAARRKPLESFMLPLAAAGGVLICRDNSLVSLVRIDGARAMTGAEELDRFVDVASRRLNAAFSGRGHAIHAVFERAPDAGQQAVEAACARARAQAVALGLDLGDVLEERDRRLGPLCTAETFVAAVWTRPSALAGAEARRDRRRARARVRAWLPAAEDSQCPFDVFDALMPRHEAFLDGVAALLDETGIAAEPLDGDAALRVMRRMLNGAETTASSWRPATAANDVPPRVTEPVPDGAFPPPLAPQLLIREPERAGRHVRIGERLYAPLDMILGPRTCRPYEEFAEALAAGDLPVRFSLLIEGGGLVGHEAAAARIAASFLAFSSADSLHVRDSMRALADHAADARAVVRLRLGLLTWVGADEGEDALLRRVSRLQQAAEAWGEAAYSPISGDPLEAVAGSVPGFACGGTAVAARAPLAEALRLLPAGRPAPLAREAVNHVFRAPDGRMLPWSVEEGEDYGVDLIYGVPGRGKSVLLNSLGLAHLLQGGQSKLPLLAVIDIGPSSSGLVSLLREALPADRQGEAGWFPLRMAADSAINPCDTPLGCRRPLPAGRAFLENLLQLIFTPAGAAGVPDGLREAIGPVIDAAYAMRADDSAGAEPNRYSRGRDAAVDDALALHDCHVPADALWWEVVDLLFDAGAAAEAARAQRYAVPVLVDFVAAVRADAVQGLIANARHGAGAETVTEAFIRILTGLSGTWPIMFAPTAFDPGDVRIAAADLREVAPRGSPDADRQTAAMYMLARHALTWEWWTAEEDLELLAPRYRSWHERRSRDIREAPKRLCFDEYHRTAAAPAARAQVERDVREARKQRVRMALASQRLEDFGETLAELANRYWILGSGGHNREIEAMSETFRLSATLQDVVRYSLTGPGRSGAPALLIAAGPKGRHEQLLVNTPGPVELWALTTAPRDVALRNRVAERLPPAEARAALARAFPGGTAAPRIDAELRRREARAARAEEAEILDRLAADLANEFPAGNAAAAGTARDEGSPSPQTGED